MKKEEPVSFQRIRNRGTQPRTATVPALRTALLFVLLVSVVAAPPASAITNAECMDCHADPSLETTTPDGKPLSLYVGAAEFDSSIHGSFGCTDCHADAVEIPHSDTLAPVDCSMCHSDAKTDYDGSVHGKAMAAGTPDAPGCADCHGKHNILPASNPASTTHPQQVVSTCARCHANPEIVARHDITVPAPVDAYMKSVHGRALLVEGKDNAPSCGACHPAHTMLAATDPASTVNRMQIPATCAQCHGDISKIYLDSIHGVAAMKGVTDSPVCTDCHGEHEILPRTDPASSVFPATIAKTTCTRCHSSLVLSRRYGFDASRIATYEETYHGLASQKGALNVANCASCHGVHDIFPSTDPRSTVHAANLQKTCGTCHPNASVQFASIQVHPEISEGVRGLVAPKRPRDVAKQIYVVLLVVVLGGMALHNFIIWLYHVIEKRRRELMMPRVVRFTRFEAVEHALLLSSFFILVFTGLALKFPDAGWVNLTESLGLSESLRGLIHRIAAVVMMAVSVAHTGYLVFTKAGRREAIALMPRVRDVQDFVANMSYHLRKTDRRPVFAHFDYTEKAEYLALIWGTLVMVFTGLVLWFPTYFTQFMPGWIVEVSEVVHYYEAWLAFLAIVIWHFFFVMFHPESHPLNLTFMDGKITVDHAMHKHGGLEEGQTIEYPEGSGPPSGEPEGGHGRPKDGHA